MNRQDRVNFMVQDAPVSVRGALFRAFSGAANPRAAIKAMCLTCMGYDRGQIENCTGWSCPLWEYRPFSAESRPKQEKPHVPTASTIIQAEDQIIAVTTPESEEALRKALRGS